MQILQADQNRTALRQATEKRMDGAKGPHTIEGGQGRSAFGGSVEVVTQFWDNHGQVVGTGSQLRLERIRRLRQEIIHERIAKWAQWNGVALLVTTACQAQHTV